ncbi:type III secretion protein R [Variovorax boronicumulans]|uniref:type III secretion system export apparatus subunit SctR n=1 Tax=Variovorax boronicumulans TaxID=436515 RepID=UPI00277ECC22|nr:type III secretion system export apparatus subunit SctR [Variovorax boronicumulans]MDQ0083817.1 type III secretion protein R [Variovorax boronicumulans]
MNYSIDPIALAILLAGLSLMPMVLICSTCFLKISMVLVIVRNAIGVQQVPPSIAIYSIALAVTLLVMAPVFKQVSDALPKIDSAQHVHEHLGLEELKAAAEPLRRFMLSNTAVEQRERFKALAVKQWPAEMSRDLADSDYTVLVPAFVVSEMQLAFEIGFVLYVPFVVIDLLVSNLLLALGMQMVSPMTISLPLKLLLFVMLNGWSKLVEGLAQSYL